MAYWVKQGTENPKAIIGTAPRNCRTPAEKAWRDFVLHVQTHTCQRRCFFKDGHKLDHCKGGYPRPYRSELVLNDETKKYEYPCIEEEDTRISPYVPLWLLAWGANINVQFCILHHCWMARLYCQVHLESRAIGYGRRYRRSPNSRTDVCTTAVPECTENRGARNSLPAARPRNALSDRRQNPLHQSSGLSSSITKTHTAIT